MKNTYMNKLRLNMIYYTSKWFYIKISMKWMNRWMNGWMNEWMEGWINECVSEWMDGWREWMSERTSKLMNDRERYKFYFPVDKNWLVDIASGHLRKH